MTEASNRRRSEKLIKPGETLPRYDRAVSRRKQLWGTDSGRDIWGFTVNRLQRATKTLSPGPLSLPSMKQERDTRNETLKTSKLDFKVVPLEIGMGGGGGNWYGNYYITQTCSRRYEGIWNDFASPYWLE